MSFSEKSPSDLLSTSSTPNGAPSPCRITLMARRTPCKASSSGVRKRSSFSSWLEMTGLPVRKAYPAGDSRSAPTVAAPTSPSSQPTPVRRRKRFSAGMYSSTLENSASRPSAAIRTASASSSSSGVLRSAMTPSSARISCCRMRARTARSLIFGSGDVSGGASTTGRFGSGGAMGPQKLRLTASCDNANVEGLAPKNVGNQDGAFAAPWRPVVETHICRRPMA
jgi:hypothetical protein